MIRGMPRRPRPQADLSKRATGSTRDKILMAAQELFAEHGLEGTSIRMIARRCGVTDPAVHYYFRSKRELLEALFLEPDYVTLAPGRPVTATRWPTTWRRSSPGGYPTSPTSDS